MNKIRKYLSLVLVICLVSSWTVVAHAEESIRIPSSAEDITVLSDGNYVYCVENTYYYDDVLENETLVLVEKHKQDISIYARAVSHTPKDLTPNWIWWKTDGPYRVTINMNAINRVLQTTADWMEVSITVGLTVGVIQWAIEAANGNFNTNQVMWEIDDGYHYYNDYGYQRVESYFFTGSNCTVLIDTDSFTYYSSW